jgi:hypothetical protein
MQQEHGIAFRGTGLRDANAYSRRKVEESLRDVAAVRGEYSIRGERARH